MRPGDRPISCADCSPVVTPTTIRQSQPVTHLSTQAIVTHPAPKVNCRKPCARDSWRGIASQSPVSRRSDWTGLEVPEQPWVKRGGATYRSVSFWNSGRIPVGYPHDCGGCPQTNSGQTILAQQNGIRTDVRVPEVSWGHGFPSL